MKKFIMALVCFMTMITFFSCGTSFEHDAKTQLKKTVQFLAKDPSSVNISDVETVYSNDSVCILDFTFQGKNGFGLTITNKMEYVYVIDNRETDEEEKIIDGLLNLNEETSILHKAKWAYKFRCKELEDEHNQKQKIGEPKKPLILPDGLKEECIYLEARSYAYNHGHIVKRLNERLTENDINNW